jgi:hypothetical protein
MWQVSRFFEKLADSGQTRIWRVLRKVGGFRPKSHLVSFEKSWWTSRKVSRFEPNSHSVSFEKSWRVLRKVGGYGLNLHLAGFDQIRSNNSNANCPDNLCKKKKQAKERDAKNV